VGAVRVARLGTSGSVDHASADDLDGWASHQSHQHQRSAGTPRPESRWTRKVPTAEDHHSGTDREIAAVSNRRVTNPPVEGRVGRSACSYATTPAIGIRTVMVPVPLVTFAGPNVRCGVVGVSCLLKMMSSIPRISTMIGQLRPSGSSWPWRRHLR
jgi:hypothetical protein